MATIYFKKNAINTSGNIFKIGDTAKDFKLLRNDLSSATLHTYTGKNKILNIFPSLDTPTCALSVRTFNTKATSIKDTVVLNISADLPFAQSRFCVAEGIKDAETLSTFNSNFSKDYNLEILDGPLAGLCSRVVIVLDKNNKVLYSEQVSEITNEPNYKNAIDSLNYL